MKGTPAEGTPALLAAAGSLWPGAQVDLGAGPEHPPGLQYALVPSAADARLLVPVRPSAAAAALTRFSAASSGRDVVTRLAAAGVTRATGSRLLRDRVTVRPGRDDEALRDHLTRVLGRPVDYALGVGPPRVNRKPVVQVFDERGRTVAFAKVGDSEQARADVRAEAAALRRLQTCRFLTLAVPEVLDFSDWNEMVVLVMTPLRAGVPVRPRRTPTPPVAAMRELATAFGEERCVLGATPWWRRRHDTVRTVVDGGLHTRLGRCLTLAGERHGDRGVDLGAWHGDWTPWNMAWRRSRVLLWDWERFETGVPAGLDACHHRVQTATRRHGLDLPVVLAALRGVDDLTADLYLLAISTRYAALVDAERGADIADGARVMTGALEVRLTGVWPDRPAPDW